MTLSANTTFTVDDAAVTSEQLVDTVMPPVGYGTGGRGRLNHPVLGVYDYVNSPTEVVNLDGTIIYRPDWLHSKTLAGGVDTLWQRRLRDTRVIERWVQGDVGCQLQMLQAFIGILIQPPDPAAGSFVQWSPNYCSSYTFNVVVVDVRSGGAEITIDRRLKSFTSAEAPQGWAPAPVELELRVVSAV